MRDERILIVGAGVAGLMMKNRLEALGYRPILAEKGEALRTDGAGLLLGANVTKIFRSIGLEEELLKRSQTINALVSTDDKASSLGKIDLKSIEERRGYPTIVIHRQELHDLLSSTIDQDTIWLNHKLIDLRRVDSGYEVSFENGKVETFDRVIAADGLFSRVKEILYGKVGLRHTNQACWRFITPTPKGVNPQEGIEMWGDQKRVGIFPIAGDKSYIFLVESMRGGESELSFDQVLEHFNEFKGSWTPVAQSIDTSTTPLLFGELADTAKITLAKEGVVFTGDAAHSTTPNMGQGAAMGIESAYMIGELLKENSFDEMVELYQAKRYNKVHAIREKSMMFGNLAHTKSSLIRGIRNFIMKITPDSVAQKQFEDAIFKD
jgi:FAD-dependent urate hydroxylase